MGGGVSLDRRDGGDEVEIGAEGRRSIVVPRGGGGGGATGVLTVL
jgi:hypothetical protein